MGVLIFLGAVHLSDGPDFVLRLFPAGLGWSLFPASRAVQVVALSLPLESLGKSVRGTSLQGSWGRKIFCHILDYLLPDNLVAPRIFLFMLLDFLVC